MKNTKTWRLTNILLNNAWVTSGIKEEIKGHLETNEKENTTTPNLRGTEKVALRGKFRALQAYGKKQEKSQTI